MKKHLKLLFAIFLLALLPTCFVNADSLADKLSGRILLQVEQNGEAWYLNPDNNKRYFLGRPSDAFNVMKNLGLGATHEFITSHTIYPDNVLGKILLDVEQNGEAYYIYPEDRKAYYLGRPLDAFNIMRNLGLGITDANLAKISFAKISSPTLLAKMEKDVHNLVNIERISNGLGVLLWNNEVATVAREHSKNLADENINLTGNDIICSYPIIHHEGYTFGLYQNHRLENREIYYFSSSGENIALISEIKTIKYYSDDDYDCASETIEQNFKARLDSVEDEQKKIDLIKNEIEIRIDLLNQQPEADIQEKIYFNEDEVKSRAVDGWMNSPGHRANILSQNFDEAGIGIAKINSYFIMTQVFIKKIDCGYKNGPCCKKQGYYPYCYAPLNCVSNICQE